MNHHPIHFAPSAVLWLFTACSYPRTVIPWTLAMAAICWPIRVYLARTERTP